MPDAPDRTPFLDFIVDRVNIGIFVVNKKFEVQVWNKFMETHSGRTAQDILGRNLFKLFPEVNRQWLTRKINNVFLLQNFAFTSWEQRPYLFRFQHNRPITSGVDYMRQDCTFMPIRDPDGKIGHVCVTIFDVTDTSVYQSRLRSAMHTLQDMSCRDGLTGIYNRRYVEDALSQEFGKAMRYGGELSLLMFDLDNFKQINDNHGHHVGDEVLKAVAQRVSAVIRQVDVFGRYGGEEFAIVLPGTGLEDAQVLAERLRRVFDGEKITVGDTDVAVTTSIGLSEVAPGMGDHTELLQRADAALYTAKRSGRNQVRYAEPAGA